MESSPTLIARFRAYGGYKEERNGFVAHPEEYGSYIQPLEEAEEDEEDDDDDDDDMVVDLTCQLKKKKNPGYVETQRVESILHSVAS